MRACMRASTCTHTHVRPQVVRVHRCPSIGSTTAACQPTRAHTHARTPAQARLALFKALTYYALQPGGGSLDSALADLCASTPYLLPDTPELQLAQHAQNFRCESGPGAVAADQGQQGWQRQPRNSFGEAARTPHLLRGWGGAAYSGATRQGPPPLVVHSQCNATRLTATQFTN